METLKKTNDALTGFRGLLLMLVTWAGMYLDVVFSNLTGITPEALKTALIANAPLAAKLVWTDAKPRIMAWFAKA